MLASIFIAIGLSMDSFAVSMACGSGSKSHRLKKAAVIAASFAFFQSLAAVVGFFAGVSFLPAISSFDHWAAFLLLAYIGGRMVHSSFLPQPKCVADQGPGKLVLLSIATSIDALAVGVSFALLRVDIAFNAAVIAFVTFAFSFSGAYFGSRLRESIGRKAELFGGLVLIAIGVKILLEHTGILVL